MSVSETRVDSAFATKHLSKVFIDCEGYKGILLQYKDSSEITRSYFFGHYCDRFYDGLDTVYLRSLCVEKAIESADTIRVYSVTHPDKIILVLTHVEPIQMFTYHKDKKTLTEEHLAKATEKLTVIHEVTLDSSWRKWHQKYPGPHKIIIVSNVTPKLQRKALERMMGAWTDIVPQHYTGTESCSLYKLGPKERYSATECCSLYITTPQVFLDLILDMFHGLDVHTNDVDVMKPKRHWLDSINWNSMISN